MTRKLKLLHTSDIHTGRRLMERDRTDEFRRFYEWLEGVIRDESIDTLLISGDVFDSSTPSVAAQNIYYSFLGRIARSSLRHTVIISGNHDSPSFIDAPSELLRVCDVHVIGQACEDPRDEVIALKDSDGEIELLVCAVPFLRDRDVRRASMDDSIEDIDQAMRLGITNHYERVIEHALSLRGESDVPIVAMGHMFLKSGKTLDGEGMRSLYVGTAPQVGSDIFPEDVAYTALGHLHSPQSVGRETIRYSGSPIAMTFGESGQAKSVSLIELDGRRVSGMKEIPVPVFQRMERISGTIAHLEEQMSKLGHEDESIWLEVTHKDEEPVANLQERLNERVKMYPLLEILSVHDECRSPVAGIGVDVPTLESISPMDMLELCFDSKNKSEELRVILRPLYQEILHELEVQS